MPHPFRTFHLLEILQKKESHNLPLDLFLSQYFRSRRAIGSKDRKEICERLYTLIRWQGLIDSFLTAPLSWEKRLSLLDELESLKVKSTTLPKSTQVSFPAWYFEILKKNYGEEEAIRLCLTSNEQAPITVRANTLKISREALFERFKDKYPVRLSSKSSQALIFEKRINFFALQEFKDGLFEIQDEASQMASDLVEPKLKDKILDFCSGSGGKTLAFAPKLKNTGQIYLHDIRKSALIEAKKRLYRAGIQNAQIVHPQSPILATLKKKMDWVFVDVPCSGSGTLRRNPDLKWNFSPDDLEHLVLEQRAIFQEALVYVRKGGHIIYATCSLFAEENSCQVKFFLENLNLRLKKPPFQSLPERGGMDGFFAAVFEVI